MLGDGDDRYEVLCGCWRIVASAAFVTVGVWVLRGWIAA